MNSHSLTGLGGLATHTEEPQLLEWCHRDVAVRVRACCIGVHAGQPADADR